MIIDTSHLNVNQLRRRVEELFGGEDARRLRVTVLSFGFKYGLPPDADFVLDARFLPNPYWVPELRDHTGREEAVSAYVLGQEGADDVRRARTPPDQRDRARLRAGGQALPDRGRRLHRRQAPQRGDRRGAGRAGCATCRLAAPRLSTATWGGNDRRPERRGPGGRVRRRARAVRVAAGAAALRRPSSTWTSPRWSRSATTAAPAAGCGPSGAACPRATCARRWPRWPATTRHPTQRRPTCSSTGFAGRPDDAGRARGRQPAAAAG